MALVFADRVKETTTTTGTGTITLAGAATGFQSFAAVGNGNTTYYTISGGSEWEVGIGTYTSAGTTLSRTTVLASSNAGSLVTFSAGTKEVICTYPSEKLVIQDGANVLAGSAVLGVANGGTGTATAFTAGSVLFAGASGVYSQDNANLFWDDTNNRLGIGTSSPATKLVVSNGGADGLELNYNGLMQSYNRSTLAYQPMYIDASIITFRPSGTEAMRIDSSGNLGIGVTPSASNLPTIESGYGLIAGQQQMNLMTNAYYNGGFKYQGTGYATRYYVDRAGGAHIWNIAPSGTAGTAISFTQAMTLDASGNLALGATTAGARLDVTGNTFLRGDLGVYSATGGAVNSTALTFGSAALINAASIYSFTSTSTAGNLILATAQTGTGTMTERLRIAATGAIGLSGANYGTSGQVLTSSGSGSAPTWTTVGGTGTVTSVGGTGTVNGLTLTGTVTTTGNLTLGGTLDLSAPPAIGGTTPSTGAFTTVTAPIVAGGSAAGSTLTLESTSGAGTTDSIRFLTASQSEKMRIHSSGGVSIGNTTDPGAGNATAVGFQSGYSTTATAAGTTTLTVTSNQIQYFTGTTTQTLVLPVTSTLQLGWSYHVANTSTGVVTVQSSGANVICTIPPGLSVMFTCILTSGTTAASWDFGFTDFGAVTGTGSVVLSTSPTLVTPALGTPASGVVTNLTGTASININGTVGATTPAQGTFTNKITNTNDFLIQPAPNAQTANFTATVANLLGGIITVTSASAVALTLPTGTLTDAGVLAGAGATNISFDWSVINLGSSTGAVTMTAGTAHTYVGNATVAISTSARFRTRKTAANTYVTYRIS